MHHVLCSLLVKHQITQVTQHALQPRYSTMQLLAFPKTNITFERDEISDCPWDSEKYDRAADGDWENCEVPRYHFEGDWGVIVLCTMFLVSLSSSVNVSVFHITWLHTFWTDLVYTYLCTYVYIHTCPALPFALFFTLFIVTKRLQNSIAFAISTSSCGLPWADLCGQEKGML